MNDAGNRTDFLDGLLLAILPHVAFDHWSTAALKAGAADLGLSPADLASAFPEGVADAVAHFADWADRAALKAMAGGSDDRPLRTHERVAIGLRARLEALEPWREASRDAVAWTACRCCGARPDNLAWRSSDRIWRAAGDRSTDFNYYSKRALLCGVLVGALLYWLQDESPGREATRSYIDRHLQRIISFGGRIGRLRGRIDRFDPAPLLRRLRRAA